jgi:hypothetical protein
MGLLALAVYLFIHRRQRIKQEIGFDASILGTIDRSIDRLQSYATWVKRANILFWILLLIIGVVSFAMYYDSKPFWLWPPMGAFGLFAWFAVRRQLKEQRRSIEKLSQLREKLVGRGKDFSKVE